MGSRMPVRTDLADAFWRDLLDRVEEMIDARQMTMGTVKGRDGGKVTVRLDDEDEDRTIGFPRSMGVAYDNGDRVTIGYARGGDPMVLGVMGNGPSDRRVRNEQMDTNSVDDRALKSVNGRGDVDHKHLTQSLSNQIANAPTNSSVNTAINDKTKDFVKDGSGRQKVARAGDLENLAAKSEIARLDKKIKELETKIKRLSEKKGKTK